MTVTVSTLLGACPGRVADAAAWCDTHGGLTATCTVCDSAVRVTDWVFPVPFDETLWLIGAH